MGRSSQILGEALEQHLTATATLPVWIKVPTRRTTRGRAQAGSIWLDYVGCTESGLMVTGDAKVASPSSNASASILGPSQRIHADRAMSANALVVVLAGWPHGDGWQLAVIPWSRVILGVRPVSCYAVRDGETWCDAVRRYAAELG